MLLLLLIVTAEFILSKRPVLEVTVVLFFFLRSIFIAFCFSFTIERSVQKICITCCYRIVWFMWYTAIIYPIAFYIPFVLILCTSTGTIAKVFMLRRQRKSLNGKCCCLVAYSSSHHEKALYVLVLVFPVICLPHQDGGIPLWFLSQRNN